MMLPAASWFLNAVPLPAAMALPEVTATVPCRVFNGSVSVKETPVSAAAGFGLLMVKVRVEVPSTATALGEKLFVMVGGAKLHPVKMMSSRYRNEEAFFEPAALTRNFVELVPVACAWTVYVVQEVGRDDAVNRALEKGPPSALEYTYRWFCPPHVPLFASAAREMVTPP